MSSTAITNIMVFDGETLTGPKTVVIENGLISSKTAGDTIVDGTGCTLLPGLIDSHVHVDFEEQLKTAAQSGITTMFEMANPSTETLNSLRSCQGLTSLIGCNYPATAEHKMQFPDGSIVTSVTDAERYVREVVALGADFIKIIIEEPVRNPVNGITPKCFDLQTLTAIVAAVHKQGKITLAHVTTPASYKLGIDAGVDVLTHTPIGATLPQSIIDEMKTKHTILIPTMVMMEGIAARIKKMNPMAPVDFHNAVVSVSNMHDAGITILAGTDANDQMMSPYQLPHNTLHNELALLVEAGLTPIQALQSATSIPADVFGLKDRGVIAVGKRADLLLVEGDPTVDIKTTRAIKGVWAAGVKVDK